MKSITPDMSRFAVVPGLKGSERGDMLDKFRQQLNPQRKLDGYAPLTYGRLSKILEHVATEDLHAFYSDCMKASCGFSRAFWGRLKVAKNPQAS